MRTTPSPTGRRTGRLALVAAATALLTSGCNGREVYEQAFSLGWPNPVTTQGHTMYSVWLGAMAGAAGVGVAVIGLILWAVVRYRKTGEELPRQVRYNLPIEVLYTVVPFVIIAVLFFYTAVGENKVNKLTKNPDVTIGVVGFQWNWQFNYVNEQVQVTGAPEVGQKAQLVLPVNKKIRFIETSPGRHPLVLGAGLPVQARRHPGAHQPVRAHRAEDRHLRRPLRRALRGEARPHELQRPRGVRAGLRQLHRQAPGRPERRHRTPCLRRSPPGATDVTLISNAAPPIANRRPHATAGSKVVKVITTTDHKTIGLLYLCTGFGFFLFSGALAEIMRMELARPGLQIVSQEQYNQLFTMHGAIMMFLVAPPLAFGFTNFIMPLQIGAPDMSFPRLNAFSYWLYLFGGLTVVAGFLTPDGAADFGWFAYAPLNDIIHSPNVGSDLWIVGLVTAGLGTILGAVNFITTIITLRAPGMTMFRMPIFTWNMLVTSILVLMAFPVLTAAFFALEADRHLGAHVFDAGTGGAILWQHLFWFFGHPEVYIVALPFFGIVIRGHPGVQPQADLRLQGPGLRHHRHRRPVDDGVGPPHVRHRRGPAAVLLLPVVPHRRPDRREVLQLDRHHVARASSRSRRRCCSASASSSRSCSAA